MNRIDYLRISAIDRCNFRCQYCMPEGMEMDYLLKEQYLTDDELLGLLKEVFIPVGFTKFRLTGGEPLLRPNLVEIIREIASFPETEDIALTTNGFLLADMAADLYKAGLRRINISLDSLDAATFDLIIGNRGRSRWLDVWQGIQAAAAVGFDPLKINAAIVPGINDREVLDLAALTIDRNWHVRFIEFMPIGNDFLFQERGWLPSSEIRDSIREKWGINEGKVRGNGPADIFQIPGAKGTLGFISQMSECFCDRCNRMRLSADGWLRPCLLNETGEIDLKTSWRDGEDIILLRDRVRNLIDSKPDINYKERDSGIQNGTTYRRTMSQIGG
jgi:GTP 3',8-cyclase